MYKILGQVAPAATTVTDLLTVASGERKYLRQLNVCNRGAGAVTYRIAIVPSGVLGNEHYLYWDRSIAATTTELLDIPDIILEAGAKVKVYASTNELSFALLGT